MPVSKEQLEKRQRIINALKELKSTHTILEISQIINIPFYTVRQVYERYCEKIPLTNETKKRLFDNKNRWNKELKETRKKVFKLSEQGLSLVQISEKLNISYNDVHSVYYRAVINTPHLVKIKKQRLVKNEITSKKPSHDLVLKYAKEKQFDLKPLFFIKHYGVTIATASKICAKLQALKE